MTQRPTMTGSHTCMRDHMKLQSEGKPVRWSLCVVETRWDGLAREQGVGQWHG